MREFVEKITFFNRGNTGPSVSYKPVYDCIQESDNDTNNDTIDLRLDCEEGLDHDYEQFFSNDFSTIVSYTGHLQMRLLLTQLGVRISQEQNGFGILLMDMASQVEYSSSTSY